MHLEFEGIEQQREKNVRKYIWYLPILSYNLIYQDSFFYIEINQDTKYTIFNDIVYKNTEVYGADNIVNWKKY